MQRCRKGNLGVGLIEGSDELCVVTMNGCILSLSFSIGDDFLHV